MLIQVGNYVSLHMQLPLSFLSPSLPPFLSLLPTPMLCRFPFSKLITATTSNTGKCMFPGIDVTSHSVVDTKRSRWRCLLIFSWKKNGLGLGLYSFAAGYDDKKGVALKCLYRFVSRCMAVNSYSNCTWISEFRLYNMCIVCKLRINANVICRPLVYLEVIGLHTWLLN